MSKFCYESYAIDWISNTAFFSTLSWFYIDYNIAEHIYFPKTRFRKIRLIEEAPQYSPSEGDYYWYNYPHHFEYYEVLKVEVYCSLTFDNFPFDSHSCEITHGLSGSSTYSALLNKTVLIYDEKETKKGEPPLQIQIER